jgi:hypothetical protein
MSNHDEYYYTVDKRTDVVYRIARHDPDQAIQVFDSQAHKWVWLSQYMSYSSDYSQISKEELFTEML